MDRGEFCRQSRLLVVAGKGGVGKTTVAAALARMAADLSTPPSVGRVFDDLRTPTARIV